MLQGAGQNAQEPADLVPVAFDALAGWPDDDHLAALHCFRLSAARMQRRRYSTKSLGIDADDLAETALLALQVTPSATAARDFFERHFRPHAVRSGDAAGFVTGYYEPEVEASPVPTRRFSYPLYRRPPDLADLSDATRPAKLDPSFMFARDTGNGLVEYFDRAEIEAGALSGRGLELAWIEDPVDGFFIHIQGSARLTMQDGTIWRISYAGKTGHPFTPIGAWLVANGHVAREAVTMDTIRSWLARDAGLARELMNRNRSFIFFERTVQEDAALGPLAAAGTALVPGRSLAIDHRLHTFGTPVFVSLEQPLPVTGEAFRRLMVAQDTGSAIIGPARGDIFIGSGPQAGHIAGAIRHRARFHALVPQPRESR